MNPPASKGACDAVVIGAGHNGLTAAAWLARAGRRVLVVERRPILGGAAATEEIFPGFRADTGAYNAGAFLPSLLAELHLAEHGLEFLQGPALVFAPQPDGRALTLWRDVERSAAEIACYSASDAARYPAFARQLARMAGVLDSLRVLTPPELPGLRARQLLPWLGAALRLRRLGKRGVMEFLRALPMPVTQFLDGWFESPALKGAIGCSGVAGSLLGPRSAGTTLQLLYQAAGGQEGEVRSTRFVRGGMGRLTEALAGAARRHGAEICLGEEVRRVLLEGDRAVGVELRNGERIPARVVLSSASPRHTFFELLGAPGLPVRFVRELKNVRYRGSTARVILALSGLPEFSALRSGGEGDPSERLSGRIVICPNLDYLEQAFDDAKYGRISRKLYLDAAIPTLLDGSLAPPGRHLMLVDVRYAPYHLRNGDWEEAGEALLERTIDTLEACAPGLRELVLHRRILTPLDLERTYGLPEGSIYHGQMALDQLMFLRPAAGYGRYRTPIGGLYLCGAGAHPGGGVTGAPGYNAAREALADWIG